MISGKLKRYSPLVLRIGIAVVFFFFSISQLTSPDSWTRMIPEYATFLGSPLTLVYANGIFEIVFATLLLIGYKTRFVAAVLTLHILHIVTILGWGPTGARDFSLSIAILAIFFQGPDEFTLDHFLKKRR